MKKTALKALLTTLVCLLINASPVMLEKLISSPLTLSEVSPGLYETNLSHFPHGNYYVSLGKTMAPCNILLNDEVIFRGYAEGTNKKPIISHGAALNLSGPSQLQIKFKSLEGNFDNRFYHTPVIASYEAGIFLQQYRDLIDLQIGPLSAVVLIFGILSLLFVNKSSATGHLRYFYTGFGVVSLLYSLSLSHVYRSYFEPNTATVIHIFLRFVLGTSAYLILTSQSKPRKSIIAALFVASIAPLILNSEIISSSLLYKTSYTLLPVFFFIAFFDLEKDTSSISNRTFAFYALSWAFAQSVDLGKLWTQTGVFLTPVYLALFNMVTLNVLRNDVKRQQERDSFITDVQDNIHSNTKIDEILVFLGRDLQRYSPYKDISIYLDDFVLGKNSEPFKTVTMVYCSSSRKDSIPANYVLSDNAENPMTIAFLKNEIVKNKSEIDHNWYFCLPVHKMICINITTRTTQPEYALSFVSTLVNDLYTSLIPLRLRIEALDNRMDGSLAPLKKILGNGNHVRDIGAIFIDVVDYSKHTEFYGNEYPEFISGSLFPALMKHMNDFATPEVVRGDEIYFVITNETSKVEGSIQLKTERAIERMNLFFEKNDLELTQSAGFPKTKLRLGATFGQGTIVVDDVQVRTSGEHINKAKRLQEAASSGDYLIDFNPTEVTSNLIKLATKTIVVKKNVIEAVKVGVKRAA